MNIVLLNAQADDSRWRISDSRQIQHIIHQLKAQVGDTLKIGIQNQARYLSRIVTITPHYIEVEKLQQQPCPPKLPVTLCVALPRPKVLRRIVMDSVTLGVEKLVLFHSYRVDKSYWQTPFLQKLADYAQLGLEQAGDVFMPEIVLEKRFKPFVEDRLALWTNRHPTFVADPYSHEAMPTVWNQPCQLVIGTEGGFIPYEIDLLKQNGCRIYHLGSRILRTETAVAATLGRLFV